ncbi:uncharacterized protein LOC130744335 [Lotus japonicus]|uniref:uncharacterized protein LOC130744335 n=1 Tax=Lotus japonicus TaxID=34305 RepID=UPI0025879A0F|nr:uncharacterized protein LOC130744335 [Lotus japonicus]
MEASQRIQDGGFRGAAGAWIVREEGCSGASIFSPSSHTEVGSSRAWIVGEEGSAGGEFGAGLGLSMLCSGCSLRENRSGWLSCSWWWVLFRMNVYVVRWLVVVETSAFQVVVSGVNEMKIYGR